MAGQIFRGAIYLFIVVAVSLFSLAAAVDFGLEIMPLPYGWEWALPADNFMFLKLGLISLAIAVGLFLAHRLWRQT